MKKMNKKGFTIVELSIVIAVIAILSAVLVPTFTSIVSKSKSTAAIQEAQTAYTEYTAKSHIDNKEVSPDGVYAHGSNGFIAIKAGKVVVDANGKFIYHESADDALKALYDDPATADTDESEDYELVDADKVSNFTPAFKVEE